MLTSDGVVQVDYKLVFLNFGQKSHDLMIWSSIVFTHNKS